MYPKSTDVVVVGAGPTGLATALALTRHDVECVVLDAAPAGANTSRAAVVHARTLEVLEPLGVCDTLLAAGTKAPRFSVRDRDRNLIAIDFSSLPTRYPYTLMVSQATTEQVLLDELVRARCPVLRPATVDSVTDGVNGPAVKLSDGSTISARWIVGADGMHSTVREYARIGFTGATYPHSFLLADVATHGAPTDQVILFLSPAGLLVLAPLPGGTHRVVATVQDAPEHPTTADVDELLRTRGPRGHPVTATAVGWGSRFRVHHRLAQTYRHGHIVLAGDAAHVHSPAGGQGMNIGIQDGVALGAALADAARGNEAAVDRYGELRRPVAAGVLRTTDRLTWMATLPAPLRPLRNAVLAGAGRLPTVPRRLARQLSGLTTA